ncbi:hypothetical protein K438DRAFT_1786656 [Mycena galopus ATCC 62051]|nr:hypothetical protein K438DRAFT_1786656 [Mycena galopus ATCC 62051]
MPAERCPNSTHNCPICYANFPNRTQCLQHINQPSGQCRRGLNSLHPAVLKAGQSLTEKYNLDFLGEKESDDNDASSDSDSDRGSDLSYNTPGFDDRPVFDNDPMEDIQPPHHPAPNPATLPTATKPKLCKEYFPGTAQTYTKDKTFIDNFHSDKYAQEREAVPYYPFASVKE